MSNPIKEIFTYRIRQVVGLILLAECASFFVTYAEPVNSLLTVALLTIFACISWKNLFHGLLIVIAELMIGSKGYLFAIGGEDGLSIRLGLFLVLFFVWLFKYIDAKKLYQCCLYKAIPRWLVLFLIMVAIGMVMGVASGYDAAAIFFDANGYLYLGLFFIFMQAIRSKHEIYQIAQVMLAALITISIKMFFLVYIFTHGFETFGLMVYRWVRMSGVGEITRVSLDHGFHRIFFQSQIWSLILIFIILAIICCIIANGRSIKSFLAVRHNRHFSYLLVLAISGVIVSFSRSFWLGMIVGTVVLFSHLLIHTFRKKRMVNGQALLRIIAVYIGSVAASVILILAVANFPIPQPDGGFGFGAITSRASDVTDEAAINSRWNLLPPLIKKIQQGPLLGMGFGTTVTYESEDPRIAGEYTTYAFEWGYLDTVTEIGILGLLIFAILYIKILLVGIANHAKLKGFDHAVNLGFLIALIVLAAVHFFSPYLNHPLGLGILMLSFAIFRVYSDEKVSLGR